MKAHKKDVPGPRFIEKVMLWLSTGRCIDGLWVGTAFPTNADAIYSRLEPALQLIKVYDRRRYDRIARDLERVWVRLLPASHGRCTYNSLWACELDERFVLADSTLPEDIAGLIVHEATHARLHRCGIGYEEGLRQRVEEVCVRRELAFANQLPDGRRLREFAEQRLATPAALTNVALQERYLEGSIEVLRHLGYPDWLVRFLVAPIARRTSRTRRGRGANKGYRITKDSQFQISFDKPSENIALNVLLGSKYTPDTRVSYDDLAVITNPGSAFEWRTEINDGPMSAEVQAFLTLHEPELNSQSSLQSTVSTPGVLNRLLDSPNGEGREKCDRTG
jgi:hypothetical protein